MHAPTATALTPRPLDSRRLLRVLWLEKWLILIVIAAATVLGGTYAFYVGQAKHAATVTLEVVRDQPDLRDVTGQLPRRAIDPISRNTQLQLLTADSVLGAVILEAGLLSDPEFNRYLAPTSGLHPDTLRRRLRVALTGRADPPIDDDAVMAKTIDNLRAALTARPVEDTHLFMLTAQSRDPDKAKMIANLTARTYVALQVAAQQVSRSDGIAWLRGRVTALRQDLVAAEAATDTGNAAQRDLETKRNLYLAFATRLQEAQVQQGLDAPDAQVVSPATATRYAGPRKVLILQASVAIGGVAALLIVMLRYFGRQGVLHPAMLAPMRIATLKTDRPSETEAAEIARQIALASDAGNDRILVTSCGPDSTRIVDALAERLGRAGGKVLLLAKDSPAAQVSEGVNFKELPVNLDAKALRAFLDPAQQDCDTVIILTPKSAEASLTEMLARHCDTALVIFSWAKTPREEVARTARKLRDAGVRAVIGVMTQTNPDKMREFAMIYPEAPSGHRHDMTT